MFDSQPGFHPEKELAAIYDQCLFLEECFSSYDEEWRRARQVLIATQALLARRGIEFLVVLIPAKEQFGCCGWHTLDEAQRLSVNTRLVQLFEEQGIAHLDLYEALGGHNLDDLYYRADEHWTAKGHSVAAGAISRYLARLR